MDQNKPKKDSDQMVSFHPLMKKAQKKSGTKSTYGAGKHVCDECGKGFRVPSHLQIHVDAVHLKLKPYKCEDCDFAAADPSYLRGHVRNVHYKIRHQCDFCDYSSGFKHDVTRHTKRKHKKEFFQQEN